MKVKHNELKIPKGNPFARCKLGRRVDADALNDLIESIEGGGTVAINGAWGFGKTTFLRMWQQDLEQKGYRVILFNAWETDFSTEPLVSIFGEIGSLINDPNDTQLEEISKGLAKFTKKVTPLALSMLVKKLTGIDCAEIVKELGEHAISSFEEEVRSYKERKEEFGKIKEKLEKLVEAQSPGKPVIFIVDELDRCRPDYAVEVLEKIKHLFSVNNLIFVLAVDKEQLCHAIKGYYGSSELNASEYLRRFIDIEYDLGCSNYLIIVLHFFYYFDLHFSVSNMEQSNNDSYINRSNEFIELIALISQEQRLSIRQVEKWIVYLKAIVPTALLCCSMQSSVIILVTFFELFCPRISEGISRISFNLPTLIQETKNLFINHLTRGLENIDTPAQTLVIALCILYLSYHEFLTTTRHPLGLNSMGVEQNQEEILEIFFQDISVQDVFQLKKKIINAYQYYATSTDDLFDLFGKS